MAASSGKVVVQTSQVSGASLQHRVRLYGYKEQTDGGFNPLRFMADVCSGRARSTYAVGLVQPDGSQKIYHFVQYSPDDDVELLSVGPCAFSHNVTFGLLMPCASGDVREESTQASQLQRFTWVTDFAISADGYAAAERFVEHASSKWSYNLRNRNCVTFAHAVARAAGVRLSRPIIQRPIALMERMRGDIRSGRVRALAANLPPGRRFGPLPAHLCGDAPVMA